MQAKQRALEHNRLDVRFEDYLIQPFSCQSDKGEALDQVGYNQKGKTLCFFVGGGRRAFNTWLNQFISIKKIPVPRHRRISPHNLLGSTPAPTEDCSLGHCGGSLGCLNLGGLRLPAQPERDGRSQQAEPEPGPGAACQEIRASSKCGHYLPNPGLSRTKAWAFPTRVLPVVHT